MMKEGDGRLIRYILMKCGCTLSQHRVDETGVDSYRIELKGKACIDDSHKLGEKYEGPIERDG